MTRILVTRPGGATPQWATLGTVIEAPLLRIEARPWSPPVIEPEAIALTSANGVRCAGSGAERYFGLPAFAVGAATAEAARAAGWREVRAGAGTGAAMFASVAAARLTRILHLAGVDRIIAAFPPGLSVEVREVYAAVPVDLPPAVVAALAAGAIDVVPLYSPRSAGAFSCAVDAAGIARNTLRLVAISPAAAAAAGAGWRSVAIAAAPTDDALFAAAAVVCDKAS
ncbi:uroporphyrinogen-III synthase [Polymorphobacter sp. PAMC 29334]|uniref:uroporphyrinogen-III synthase n=1 Tax=Polymorphobacter sp. PAMC 29334 TaxID=2862331 RepID=UPI001C780261|nr:uroporphyrinogen-III synthase [Polymorphobacter sp. PAMC 29334]QYE35744.1 uroporphyrinogen-III synthase [Polymorphobacter sp. PAMC 29334]